MKFKLFVFILLLISGCSSNPLINSFSLPDGQGAQLNNGWNKKLNGGLIHLFKSVNGVELKHGANVAGKNAMYRVPSGKSKLGIQINWLRTIMGPVYYATAEFEVNLEEGGHYGIGAIREDKAVTIKLINSSGEQVVTPVVTEFSNTIPIFIMVPM